MDVRHRTDQEIVDQTNALARKFYEMQGYKVPDDFKFYLAHHPQEVAAWDMAVTAQLELTDTDADDALRNVE